MLYILPPPCCIFCQIQRQKRGSEAPREHTLGGSPPAGRPSHGDDAHPAPNKPHRDPAHYSAPPRSTPAGPKTSSPPRNDPNSGAARLNCTVLNDPKRPVIPGLWRGPGNGVACSGEYANAGSNGRFGLDRGKPVRCPSRKFIAAISVKLLSENHAVAYLHRFLVD